jgi:hypothetical protein
MYINISACYSLVRSTISGKPVPIVEVMSNHKIRVSGLSGKPTIRKRKGLCISTIRLTDVAMSAVAIVDGFRVYMMNTGLNVACFITNEKGYFRVIQSGKEKLSDYSQQGYYYAFESIGAQLTIEFDNEKETDKHVSIT